MRDVLFTAPAHWHWLIVVYFFFGGLSAGSYVLGALLHLFGGAQERPASRLGYLVSLPALLACPPLLIVDLDRPERFWHLFLWSQRPGVMFKWWSPMSIGSWALLLFGAFSFVSFVGALSADPWRPSWLPERLAVLGRGIWGKVLAAGGAGFAFFIAGYTGVLLSVTNRPLWAETPLLGLLFTASAMAASAALVGFVASRRGGAFVPALPWLSRMEHAAALLELLVLLLFLAWLGPAVAAWRGPYGVLLGMAVLLGLVAPLALTLVRARGHAARGRAARGEASGAARGEMSGEAPGGGHEVTALGVGLVLAGSLALRAAIVLASEALGHA
ncbi:NrfD/PsrC family molybdoenzyme membrane anchor subunit [Chondromyces apiculatus]|uniref:Polysulfide reductase, subunit C, putative n=1 Tax=Chondromyces apiculatus DSM 436 TaxID=1192034 RepID=A0A017T8J4_9BACT|nr:NrfD/PsrC family molybdoenzyme membrane anchor subunit [Chondromyces apiculatus]EYF05130.1 Polysulfide reductase, subunit C, putative [Chondromyces apiculatus DSM 436]